MMADNRHLPPLPHQPRRTTESILQSVDATPDLFPHLAELFRGIPNLGSSPASILRLAKAIGLSPSSHVIEFACGKGTVAIQIASRFGCSVTASDAFPPFIEAANQAARVASVAHRCTFQVADLHAPLDFPPSSFDAALMIGFWPFDKAARTLRTFTKPGGVYMMDDAFSTESGETDLPTVDDAAAVVQKLGDEPLIAFPFPPAAVRRMHESLARKLDRNAAQIAQREPALRRSLRAFVSRQQAASSTLVDQFRPVLLAVRKGRR